MPIPTINAEVISNKKISADVFETVFKMISPATLEFAAGQHLIFEINSRAVRQFSIASAPQIKDNFDLCVDVAPQGPGSKFIENLKAGDKVTCRGPWGRFLLSPDSMSEIIFVATGVGITPLKSMLEDIYNREKTLGDGKKIKKIELYFGVRHQEDIFYFDVFEKLAKAWPKFKFFPTLSRPNTAWEGLTGRVTDHLKAKKFDGGAAEAYLCGSGDMITDVKNVLLGHGVAENRIHFEKFFQ